MRLVNILFALLFAFAIAVQYDDPDPLRWMAMYAAGLVVCVLWELRRLRRIAALAVGLASLAWGAWIAFGTHLTAPFGEALTDWHMHAGGSEELRESVGLLVQAAWCAVLAWRPKR